MYTKYIQVDRDLPHYIWGSVTIYSFNWLEGNKTVPLYNFFATGPPRHSSPPVARYERWVALTQSTWRFFGLYQVVEKINP